MKIPIEEFRVPENTRVDLTSWPTHVAPIYKSKANYQEILATHISRLSDLQERFYASGQHALLIIFQAMDAAGKDGAIKHVMSGVNPQGCRVYSFKHPTATELEHDFLWRTTRELPARGQIGIFNRSYYEEVLILRVHPELLQAEGLADDPPKAEMLWQHRYRSIVDLERHLVRNGTRIVKIFLHLSKEEQRKRFLARIDEADKNWKFSLADIHERSFWNEYRKAYEYCLGATCSHAAPWYVVPADDKKNARLIVSRTILNTFETLKLKYPKVDGKRRRALREIRKQLIR